MHTQAGCWQLSVCFPQGGGECSSLFICSQYCRVGPAFCLCSLAVCKGLLLLLIRAHTGNQPRGGGVCVSEVYGVLGCLWASWGIHRWGSPNRTCVNFMMESMTQLIGSLDLWCLPRALSTVLAATSCPCTPHPQLCSTPQYSAWVKKKWISLAGSCIAGKDGSLLTHSHFLPW